LKKVKKGKLNNGNPEKMLNNSFLLNILITLLFWSMSCNSVRSFEDGKTAFERKEYETALKILQPLAIKGNAKAQNLIGFMYDEGEGVPRNYEEAVKWYHKAAEQGDGDAQFFLGVMYQDGKGVLQNYAEAMKWYRKAAEKGDMKAQFILGSMYQDGKGVPQDDKEAVKWYRKAAERGDVDSQLFLGNMYQDGKGVTQNYVLSYLWFNLASLNWPRNEENNANQLRDDLSKLMTPAQISEAKRLTREWQLKFKKNSN
jgi:uncharacterized protein